MTAGNDITSGLLFTDFYQLTMAQLYVQNGLHDIPAVFEHSFRQTPDYGGHMAGYAVSAGLDPLLDWMTTARLTHADAEHLRGLRTATGERMFAEDFLAWLADEPPFASLSMRAIPEGRVVHPYTPMTEVRGPLAAAQLLETALLNQLNHATLIATKASRVVDAARGCPVLEFGLRRAPGSGGNAASRAALVGGATGTSNVGTAFALDQTPVGTHAHSMVQAFLARLGSHGEIEAFRAYARTYPDDCLLLVDTVDTIRSGLPNAIQVFDELRRAGHRPVGVRIDSGDLAHLAVQAAVALADAGFEDCRIVLSSSLDELRIFQILAQIDQEAIRYGIDSATVVGRLAFGVGSRLVTSEGQPYLGGVYKLTAIGDGDGGWRSAVKVSENPWKTATPGPTDVYRLYDRRGLATADLVVVEGEVVDVGAQITLRHPVESDVRRTLVPGELTAAEPLLTDVLVEGERVRPQESLDEIRQRRVDDLDRLDPGVRRLLEPHRYHVSLSERLAAKKASVIAELRSGGS